VRTAFILSHLATNKNVTASVLLYFYRQVLCMDLSEIDDVERASSQTGSSIVYTLAEVKATLARLTSTHLLVIGLLYGTGMRLSECLSR